ncbi:oxygenase MpaB family protein [Mycobacterium sp. MAA66]|uniref:oxygenase MpaB family protein n=1 Tax=Mycobacterium sp. MAA66 TaxID=3156297 RepID=UPI0035160AB6
MTSAAVTNNTDTARDRRMVDGEDLEALIGPDSAFRRHTDDWRVMLVLGRASLLQAAYPLVSAGVVDHGRILRDPVDRVVSTARYANELMLGPDPVGTARAIREMHRDITGVDAEGTRYHAWNRDAWTWVHLTICEAVIRGINMFHNASEDEVEEVYAGLRMIGRLYQVRGQDMPPTVPELLVWFDNAIDHDIVDTQFLADLRAYLRQPTQPPQIANWLWPLLRPAAGPIVTHATNVLTGMLPAHIRHWYAPSGRTVIHQAEYTVAVALLRGLSMLPSRFHTVSATRS